MTRAVVTGATGMPGSQRVEVLRGESSVVDAIRQAVAGANWLFYTAGYITARLSGDA